MIGPVLQPPQGKIMPEYARIKSRMSEAKRRIRRGNRSNWVSSKVARRRQKVALALISLYVLGAIALYVCSPS